MPFDMEQYGTNVAVGLLNARKAVFLYNLSIS